MKRIKINKKLRNILIGLAVIILVFVISGLIPEKKFSEKYDGFDLSTSVGAVSSTKTYTEYLNEHKNAKTPSVTVDVDVLNYDVAKSYGTKVEKSYRGKDVVITDDKSSVTWIVDVEESGFYNISVEYIATPSRNVNMERSIYINGEMPFSGADILSFYRLWCDGGPIKEDNQGNAIRPSQIEFFEYQTVLFKSDLGYEVEPYKFYFNKGINTIELVSTNEPMAISKFSLVPVQTYDTYSQYLAKQSSKPDSYTKKDVTIKIQGEDSTARSDPSLFARYDRASATTEPYDVRHQKLNYTGGDSWKAPGQWIEWDLEVPEDGWYTISIKGRQLYQRGYVACRSVYIDGEIPVDTMQIVRFPYSSDWQLVTLSDENNKPMKLYLTRGTHKLRLEATLGEIGSIINDLQDSIYRLNQIYRSILVLTGKNPDPYRDYEIDVVYPEQYEAMNIESKRLYQLVDRFVAITGQKTDKIAPAETLAIELENFYKRPDNITKAFGTFKDNITSLGSSLLTMTETKLDVDYILVQGANDKIKSVRANWFKKAGHEIRSFFTSYFVDSTNLGNVYDKDSEHIISVWITAGRDQSQILKNMIDDSFSPQTGINVNVKLIVADSLLNAVVAGNGPDVVVSTYQSAPVDYALRNANVNLKRFEDCDEVLKNFYRSAYTPYEYDGGLYALPEQESFSLMFYRKDILEELDLEIPQTWEDLIEILPTLQGKNLDVGIPFPQILNPDMGTLYSMMYQNGGQIYNEKGTKSVIDSEAGIAAFKMYTSFYNSYGLPTYFDFMSRFRVGEMPLGIANYQTFNTLVVGAPEIRGLWDFTYMPGTLKEDGTIDRTNVAGTTCTMMFKKGLTLDDVTLMNNQNISYDSIYAGKLPEGMVVNVDERTMRDVMKNESRLHDSWEFMKWWTSTETQLRFGRELEAVLGASARYPTANINALRQLSWNSQQIEVLEKSMAETIAVPEVPGSYYTPRHVVNGARKVINEKNDARETLIDYTRKINEELTRKRQEFKLPVDGE